MNKMKKYYYDKTIKVWNVADDQYSPNKNEELKTLEEFETWKNANSNEHKKIADFNNYLLLVKAVATENDADIDRKEADEFSLFWSRYNATGKMPPIEQYPLVMAQVSEWARQGKLPNLP